MTRRKQRRGARTVWGFEPGKPVWATLVELAVGLVFFFGGPFLALVTMARFPLLRETDEVLLAIGIAVGCAVVTGLAMWTWRRYFFSFLSLSSWPLRQWTTWVALVPYVIGIWIALGGWVWGACLGWNGALDHAISRHVRAIVLHKSYRPADSHALPSYVLTLGATELSPKPLRVSVTGTRLQSGLFEAARQARVGKEIELLIGPGALMVPWIRNLRPSSHDKEVGGREGG